MNPVIDIKDKRAIQEAAALWIITMDNRPLSQEEQATLRAWLLASTSHRKEFIDLARVWEQLDLLASYGLDVINDADSSSDPAVIHGGKTGLKSWPGFAAAATIALCALGVVLINYPQDIPGQNLNAQSAIIAPQIFSTAIGELRDLSLGDGSVIKLNTNTRISVLLGKTERRIELLQGEASFSVAKDVQRPFVVYTPEGSVTAVGTAFNIRLDQSEANIVVTEGVVSVKPSRPETTSGIKQLATKARELVTSIPVPMKVSAGHRVQMSEKSRAAINKVEKSLLDQELAWHSGMLSFANTPLREVIAEVSRYTAIKIIIDDPEIARMPVGGYFKAGEIPAMLEVLQLSFGIKVTHLPNATILLSSSSNPSTAPSAHTPSYDNFEPRKFSP